MLDFDGWFTLATLIVMFGLLMKEVFSADFTVFGSLVVLWVVGIIDTEQALSGFSNPQVITVGLLFIVSAALQETGALAWASRVMLGPRKDGRALIARLLTPIAAMSGFLNNTPLVAMFTPAVRDWAIRNGRAPSKFLIPLSYAAILGGTCTLIGTSTNLVVSGLLEENGYAPLGMFELSPVGVPATVFGLVFIMLFGQKLLPDRRAPDAANIDLAREYGVRLQVEPDCPLVGLTIERAGLRNLSGLFLAEIEREHERIVPVAPTQRIRAGDRLVLFGVIETVVDLRNTRGLTPVADDDKAENGNELSDRRLFEVVVSANSPLVNQTLKTASFRRRYDAAVIAIHRGGERLNQKLGDVVLRGGDVLMVEGSPGFREAWGNAADFYLVAQVDESEKPRYALANIAMVVLIAMVVASATGALPVVLAAALAVILLMATRCIRAGTAKKSVDVSVLIVIAASFGLSAAVVDSGLAEVISRQVIGVFGDYHPWVVLAVIYLVTSLSTEMLSNNAAAALILPIAIETAERVAELQGMPVDPRPYAVAVAIAASMSFITPLGYQTNLMVYGPGGYRFTDFARLGIPLAVLCFVVAMVTIPMVWQIVP